MVIIMGIGLKVTITGLIIRMLQAGVIDSLERTSAVGNIVLYITSIVLCVIGIVITLFEIPGNPVKSIIYEVAQIAGSICLLINTDMAQSTCDIVIGILLIYGIFQALIHWNPVYVIYFLW